MMDRQTEDTRKLMNCDQVACIIDAIKRHDAIPSYPGISRLKEMSRYSMVLEICELLGLKLDESGVYNILPSELRPYFDISKREQPSPSNKIFK